MIDSIEHRVVRMHTAAIVCAAKGLRLTYVDLAGYIGRPRQQRIIASDFALWAKWLRSKELPPLYVIVVNEESGKPGAGCDVPAEQVKTYCVRADPPMAYFQTLSRRQHRFESGRDANLAAA
jgi:hypothetical protein